MAHDVTILGKDGSGSEGSGRLPSGFRFLDPEIHDKTYTRLAWTAFIYATVYTIAFVADWAMGAMRWTGTGPRTADLILAGTAVGMALAVFVACRMRRIPVAHLPVVALGFEVAGAWAINAGFWGWELFQRPGMHYMGVPWVCVWILAFPTVIPAAPGRTAISALSAAASGPLVMAASVWFHGLPDWWSPQQALGFIVTRHYPAFLAAGIAQASAAVVYRLSREATKARRLGSYQLTELIGAGGMGEVWTAKHRLLVRPAAIKLIRPAALGSGEASQRAARRRFEREAQATALLCSPHTIALYDFGVTDDGTFYYVMELLDGLDLKRLVEREGAIPQERAIFLLKQVCHSLADAHAAGMVHRDVKPANIFVCRRGTDYDFVKVLDFGLVADATAPDARTQLTAEGIVPGTPAFMAPETVRGGDADPRSDLYALGCVAYWLLTGTLVFDGRSAVEVMMGHANDAPVPPSSRSELPIHPDLDRIVLDCLQKDPARRPSDARELSGRFAECERRMDAWTDARAVSWWNAYRPAIGA
jgi:serine/threonine-protein kinase